MYRTVAQLDTVVAQLVATAPDLCTALPLPQSSIQGTSVSAVRIAAPQGPPIDRRPGVLLIGGTHARELMNPDLLVELAVDLVAAYRNGTDVVLGNRTWPAAQLRAMLDAVALYLLPCVNPDGRTYVMTVDDMWRKNRRDNPGTKCDGVDLNRKGTSCGASPRGRHRAHRAPTSTADQGLSASRRTRTSSICWTPTGSTTSSTCTRSPSS